MCASEMQHEVAQIHTLEERICNLSHREYSSILEMRTEFLDNRSAGCSTRVEGSVINVPER